MTSPDTMADARRPSRAAGGVWPSEDQRLLLRAALLGGDEAVEAWHAWAGRVDWAGHLDQGSFALLPLAYANLLQCGVTVPVMDRLKGIYRRAWYETSQLCHRLRGDVEALRGAGVDPMLVHGLPLALACYRSTGERPVAAVDLVVRPDQAGAAAAILAARGWRARDAAGVVETRYRSSRAFTDEKWPTCRLHWRLLDGDGVVDEFLRDADVVELDGLLVRTPNAADSLLVVLVHGMRPGPASTVCWVADAVTLVRKAGASLDWDRFVRSARERRLSLRLGMALRYIAREMDAPVPVTVQERLAAARVSTLERRETALALEGAASRPRSRLQRLQLAYAAHRRRAGGSWPRHVLTFPRDLLQRWRHRAPAPGAITDRGPWRWFAGYLRGTWLVLAFLAVVAAAQSLSTLAILVLVRHAIDTAIPSGDVRRLVAVGAGIVALRAGASLVELWLRRRNLRIVKDAVGAMRRDLVTGIYRMPRTLQTRADLDVVHSRIVSDTERVDQMANAVLGSVVPAACVIAVLAVVLLLLDPTLCLVAGAVVPVLWLAAGRTRRALRPRVVAFQRAFERFARGVRFVLHHLDLTRSRGAEEAESARQARTVGELGEASLHMAMGFAVHGQVQSILATLGGALILCVGGIGVAMGRMSLGEFLAFYAAALFLNGQVTSITGAWPHVVTGWTSLETLHRLWTEAGTAPYAGRRPAEFQQSLALVGVSFGYGQDVLLRDVSLTVSRGATIAIVGPNGSGKSTLLYLMAGFYRPQAGHLELDGVPYDELDLSAVRRSVGVVLQEAPVFDGTVLDNIRYGAGDASRAEVVESARAALAHDFIERLPDGYDTRVGPEGMQLSGGERQRIAIARALLGCPRLLVLDEPTNHLDAWSVAALLANLAALPQRPAIVTISHDDRVVEHMDAVYDLAGGRLVPRRVAAASG